MDSLQIMQASTQQPKRVLMSIALPLLAVGNMN